LTNFGCIVMLKNDLKDANDGQKMGIL